MKKRDFIPYNLPSIGDEEIAEVVAVLRSGWLTTGTKTAQFEEEFAEYVGARCSLAVNSATAGLHIALKALGIGPGDEVITTPLTFCSTVHSIVHVGGTPVLADVGQDGNIDPESIAGRITRRTRAIIPVHLGGLPCAMNEIWDLAHKHGLFVIEDAAHAIGSIYRGSPIGSSGSELRSSDAIVFSFYATKNLTTGEGGMITTPLDWLNESMKSLSLHGITKDAWNRYSENGSWYYQVSTNGFKYNLSDIQSAIGIHQLRKQEQFIQTRTYFASMYNEAFGDMPELELPPDHSVCRHNWHLYSLRLNLEALEIDRDEFIRQLHMKGIGASVHFIPVPLHFYFAAYADLPQNSCPRALALYPRLISLPLYPTMTELQVRQIIDAVKQIVCATRRSEIVPMGGRLACNNGIDGAAAQQ
jgi:dTDP-4-amino-4,6-dideoxygalactose transaminase